MNSLNISQLRKEGRPLWMTHLGHESLADLLGGGGDLWADRLYPEAFRDFGEEGQEERLPVEGLGDVEEHETKGDTKMKRVRI